MDTKWTDFLENKVNSFIKWDLVRFFHDNPHASDTADQIARYIGREEALVSHELNDLIQSGVLEREEIAGVQVYQLTNSAPTRDLITSFIEACHDREFRIQAIQHVIRGMHLT